MTRIGYNKHPRITRDGKQWMNIPRRGRYYKHAYNKAQRRAWKAELIGRRVTSLSYYRSEIDWRGT